MSLKKIKAHKHFKFMNACLLILGTSVGVGMLGMPVEMGQGGFAPGVFFLLLTWLVSLISGLLFLEVLSYVKQEVNFATLSEKIIGQGSKIYLALVYFLLFLSLLFAYVKGGGVFISEISSSIPIWMGTCVFLAFFIPFILKGADAVGKINTLLIVPMILAFIFLLGIGFKEVNFKNLEYANWKRSFISLPLLVTSFGFHIILPSIFIYLDKNKKLIQSAIVIGTTGVLIVYLLWHTYVLGVVPMTGGVSLTEALALDQTAISPLRKILQSSVVCGCAQIFYFCALTTSFLGVSLATMDFSADAFRLKKTLKNKILLSILIFLPALILSGTKLRIFYLSLKYGAGLACTLLLIIFPATLMIKVYPKIKEESLRRQHRSLKGLSIFALSYAFVVIIAQYLNFI